MKLKRIYTRTIGSGGFTLVELLVVIAIIGILASIITASLNTARSKGVDTKVKSQLNSLRSAAETYNSTNLTYSVAAGTDEVCNPSSLDTSGLAALLATSSYPDGISPTCSDTANQWSAYHSLTDGSFFCVDNTGSAKVEASSWTAPTGGDACP